jgi:lysophospholipase L1-like esterase
MNANISTGILEDAALADPILAQIIQLVENADFDAATSLARQSYEIVSRRAFSLGLIDEIERNNTPTPKAERTEGFKGVTFRAISGLDNYIRNQRFEAARKDQTAPKIVVQGDSWVSFPFLIQDLGKQLANHFPTFCIGCPGDNVADMVTSEKLDELMWSLDYTKADVLVLSGGGNEMIGEDFPNVLKDADPDLGINQAKLDAKKHEVITGLRTIIDAAQSQNPNLKVFLHSYDKPHPQKGEAWLGQVLETAGIAPQRWHHICGEIIDQYDSALQDMAAQYQNLTRVDLRGVSNDVRPGWHDEIHLSSEGYANAALKFKQSIFQAYT